MSKATFEMYEDREGKWRWRLVHDNGNIIADGGEGYASRQKCEQGLKSVKQNAPDADQVTVDSPTGGME
ncbi:HVO_2922 family protein [Halopenitus sp. H-Gu1]|uniref:HVO_2922 family protein n=1 Tax=Halopenitus sp. H-Gu1 TaxID=3242697 RepID=UPI00359CD487